MPDDERIHNANTFNAFTFQTACGFVNEDETMRQQFVKYISIAFAKVFLGI